MRKHIEFDFEFVGAPTDDELIEDIKTTLQDDSGFITLAENLKMTTLP